MEGLNAFLLFFFFFFNYSIPFSPWQLLFFSVYSNFVALSVVMRRIPSLRPCVSVASEAGTLVVLGAADRTLRSVILKRS